MSGYWVGYSYCGIMPNGQKRYFVSREDYIIAYNDYFCTNGDYEED